LIGDRTAISDTWPIDLDFTQLSGVAVGMSI
jgi:hypothetical protein